MDLGSTASQTEWAEEAARISTSFITQQYAVSAHERVHGSWSTVPHLDLAWRGAKLVR